MNPFKDIYPEIAKYVQRPTLNVELIDGDEEDLYFKLNYKGYFNEKYVFKFNIPNVKGKYDEIRNCIDKLIKNDKFYTSFNIYDESFIQLSRDINGDILLDTYSDSYTIISTFTFPYNIFKKDFIDIFNKILVEFEF